MKEASTPPKTPKANLAANASTPIGGTLTRSATKKAIKNQRITNFFPKISSPSNKNSNSNNALSENDNFPGDLSNEADSSSMKIPENMKSSAKKNPHPRDYVFIIPSSDDDTNASTRGSNGKRPRGRPPSIHSNNSRSSEAPQSKEGDEKKNSTSRIGLKNNTIDKYARRERPCDFSVIEEKDSTKDSLSHDSMPEKRLKVDHNTSQSNRNTKVNRIQPIRIGSRTKIVEYQSIPSDLNMPKEQASDLISKLFLINMPEDFFQFWDFAKTVCHRKPCSAFTNLLKWELVGPFDVLSGLITDFHGFHQEYLFRHCRYFYDPPEFQTLIRKIDSDVHFGYLRDKVDQKEPIVVSNSYKTSKLQALGDNLFTLLRNELDLAIAALSPSSQEPTISSVSSPLSTNDLTTPSKQSQLDRAKVKQELNIIKDKFIDYCTCHNISDESWDNVDSKKVPPNSFNIIGIDFNIVDMPTKHIVNEERKRLALLMTNYRDQHKERERSKLFKELKQVIEQFKINIDKKDPALIHEFGLSLFLTGNSIFDYDSDLLLTSAYEKLNSQEFLKIYKAHIMQRKDGDKVSLLD